MGTVLVVALPLAAPGPSIGRCGLAWMPNMTAAACHGYGGGWTWESNNATQQPIRQSSGSGLQLTDATAATGLEFQHDHGGSGERYLVETTGAGLALLDLDRDGRLDVYFVQSAATPGYRPPRTLHNVLYRSDRGGSFDEVTAAAGVGDPSYGQGVAAADYDNDGFVDLYVTNFGPNVLYRNNGDGTFSETSRAASVNDDLWGTSAAWADVDDDGDLDLYVVNYVDFAWETHSPCGDALRNIPMYCHPDVYGGLGDVLYRNEGDGSFADVSAAAGVVNPGEGNGLGVVFGDYDDDGDIDLYVANDKARNFLYTNSGGGTFVDDGLLAGVGYSADGKAEAGMGVDWGDYDGDLRLDVVVTNFDMETNTLYRNQGDGLFADVTFAVGLGDPSILTLGFGANWLDLDNDTDLDLFVANGHIMDNIEQLRDRITYAQANHLYRNEGNATFTEIHGELGSGMQVVKVSRGSAIGDVDNDGDLDVVISNNGASADYLRNDGGNQAGHWMQLLLVGRRANRSAAGARVLFLPQEGGAAARRIGGGELKAPGAGSTVPVAGAGRREGALPLTLEVKAGSSYCSSSDPRLHVGLGVAESAEVSIRWPGGATENVGWLRSDRLYVVQEGRGVIAARGAYIER